jgi:hypothetical protein
VPDTCGLPGAQPLAVDYAEVAVSPAIRGEVFAPAGSALVLATSQMAVAEQLRATGAHTVFWQMRLDRLVGLTTAPADPETVDEAADRLVARAARETACATPYVALNELQGGWLRTPWSATNARYRANLLQLLRRMHDRGARPFLLVQTSPPPFTGSGEAAAWWRSVAEVSDVVLQMHFSAPSVARLGPVAGSRKRRVAMRRELGRIVWAGVPPARLGLLHGFQSGRGFGGREGLPLRDWLRVVKWEALAGRQVAAEYAAYGAPLGSVWSWGWGDFPTLSPSDPDKPVIACVYLWARDPELCDAPARATAHGAGFHTSLVEGQITLLGSGVRCALLRPAGLIDTATVERVAAVAGPGRALSALFARLVEWRRAEVGWGAVTGVEQRIVNLRFGGDRAAYERALAQRGATVAIARGIIGDQLRRRRIEARLPRGTTYRSWALAAQRRALDSTICTRDRMPAPGVVDLTQRLPFLRLPGAR